MMTVDIKFLFIILFYLFIFFFFAYRKIGNDLERTNLMTNMQEEKILSPHTEDLQCPSEGCGRFSAKFLFSLVIRFLCRFQSSHFRSQYSIQTLYPDSDDPLESAGCKGTP